MKIYSILYKVNTYLKIQVLSKIAIFLVLILHCQDPLCLTALKICGDVKLCAHFFLSVRTKHSVIGME